MSSNRSRLARLANGDEKSRFSTIYLVAPASTAAERFDERIALATFAHVRDLEPYVRYDLFLPGLHWEEPRLAELDARVRARLDEVRVQLDWIEEGGQ
jgi:hypothetical protein